MNPLEDVIVAIKPIVPTLPWQIPNSIRPLDVTMPLGTSMPNEFTNVDPTGQPATVLNSLVNFGWEYVWHCHLLGHEENDMMRSGRVRRGAGGSDGSLRDRHERRLHGYPRCGDL